MKTSAFIISAVSLLLSMPCFTAYSQNWQWIDKVESDYYYAAILDFEIADNYIYAISKLSDNLVIDGDTVLTNLANEGTVLLKYNKESGKAVGYKFYENIFFNHIKSDHYGNLLLAGYYNSTDKFDGISIPNAGNLNSYLIVAKIDYSGGGIWALAGTTNSNGGTIFSLAADNQGNSIISGAINGALTLDGLQLDCNTQCDDIFLAKIDNSGNIVWAFSGGGPSEDIYRGRSVVVTDANLNIYLAASTMGNAVFRGIALNPVDALNEEINLIKFDANGNIIWHRTMGGYGTDYPDDMLLSSWGYLYITGGAESNPMFGDTTLNIDYDNGSDIFISCWDTSGNHIVSNAFGNLTWDEYGSQVEETPDGKIVIGGEFRGTLQTPGNTIHSSGGSAQGSMFIAYLDADCNLLSALTLGGATGLYDVEISSLGYVYLSGDINGSITVQGLTYQDNYFIKYTFQTREIEGNIYIDNNGNCQLDASDAAVNDQYIIHIASSDELINTDTQGYFRVYVYPGTYTVSFPQNINYPEGACTNNETVTLGSTDTLKSVSLFLTEEFSAIEPGEMKDAVIAFPNPTYGPLSIDLVGNYKKTNIKVTDIVGTGVLNKDFCNQKTISLDFDKFSKGTYLVRVQTANNVSSFKIVKN